MGRQPPYVHLCPFLVHLIYPAGHIAPMPQCPVKGSESAVDASDPHGQGFHRGLLRSALYGVSAAQRHHRLSAERLTAANRSADAYLISVPVGTAYNYVLLILVN